PIDKSRRDDRRAVSCGAPDSSAVPTGLGCSYCHLPSAEALGYFRSPLRGAARPSSPWLKTIVLRWSWIIASHVVVAAPAWAQAQGGPDPRTGPLLLLLLPIAACCFVALEMVLWVLAPVPLSAAAEAILRGRTRC